MGSSYFSLEGQIIALEELRIPKAVQVAQSFRSGLLNWVRLVECRRLILSVQARQGGESESFEAIIFDVEVELPQRVVHPIQREERIAIIFSASDSSVPETLALRKDFPVVPHLNLRPAETPRSLCLSETPYSELKLRWTAPAFIEMIRHWLAQTAIGTLHAIDQALEPLLLANVPPIVLPSDLFSGAKSDTLDRLIISRVQSGDNHFCLIAERPARADQEADKSGAQFVATIIVGAPQVHGVISNQPNNLRELNEFLRTAEIDLIGTLSQRLNEWKDNDRQVLKASLIIIVVLPKKRDLNNPVEATDVWAFLCSFVHAEKDRDGAMVASKVEPDRYLNVLEIGEHIGLWEVRNGEPGTIIFRDKDKKGDEVEVALLNPCFTLSREMAAKFNGMASREGRQITAVGMGALGSQIFLNLIRAAYGEWILIDKDFLLPHNQARHGLYGDANGHPKVKPLAFYANTTIDGPPIAKAIIADVLEPGLATAEVGGSLRDAETIFDFSASVAVARHLSHDITSTARRISVFLSPCGTDLVLLAEDAGRRTHLTSLEMQYYRYLTIEPALCNHLRESDGRIRYGHSCRDLSSTISQEYVALHAATASRALRRALDREGASIAIWQANDEDGSVKSFQVNPAPIREISMDDWTISTDDYLLEKVQRARSERLPNETGGVLIGSFDTQRKIVYVVDTLPSPPDSQERETLYIRGSQGLRGQVEEVKKITDGHLGYVGEWHSHPPGYSCAPSNDDCALFQWLTEQMARDGLPGVMFILGENGQATWQLGITAVSE